jgi:drug/metabolite transporter (DMT)-like permease
MSRFLGIVLMFLAACSYGAAAIVIKLAYRAGLQPAGLLTVQNLVAMICLWPILLLSLGMPRLRGHQARGLIYQGLLGNFALSVCYFWAARRIEVSLLSIILFTYPGLVLLYQMVVENHRVAPRELLALLSAVAGALLAVDPFHGTTGRIDGLGLLLALGSAATYAFMNIYGYKLTRDLSPMVITTLTSTVSTAAMLALLPSRDWLSMDLSAGQWVLIVASAVLSTVLPMNLMYLGLRRIGAFHASIVSVAELPCILVLAYLILQERLTPLQLSGGGLILLSIVLMQAAADPAGTGSAANSGRT